MVYYPQPLQGSSYGMVELFWVRPLSRPNINGATDKSTGDKSNHVPALHIPQLFYFYAFSAAFGWPVLLFSGVGRTAGPVGLVKEVFARMVGSPRSA